MNPSTQTKLATTVTVLVTIIAVVQTSITVPPFTIEAAKLTGGILAFLSVSLTALKQWLSAEVNTKGVHVTLVLAAATILAGLGDLLGLFTFSPSVAHWITWSISLGVMIFNILSKILFPSDFQKDKVEELKTIDKSKTQ